MNTKFWSTRNIDFISIGQDMDSPVEEGAVVCILDSHTTFSRAKLKRRHQSLCLTPLLGTNVSKNPWIPTTPNLALSLSRRAVRFLDNYYILNGFLSYVWDICRFCTNLKALLPQSTYRR